MIRLPKYEPHQLATRVGNVDPGFVQPLVNRVGQDAASSTMQSLLDSGKQLTDVAIKEYVSSETARVSQSLLAMKNDMAAERDRYMQENQGEKALDAGAHFEGSPKKLPKITCRKEDLAANLRKCLTNKLRLMPFPLPKPGRHTDVSKNRLGRIAL